MFLLCRIQVPDPGLGLRNLDVLANEPISRILSPKLRHAVFNWTVPLTFAPPIRSGGHVIPDFPSFCGFILLRIVLG